MAEEYGKVKKSTMTAIADAIRAKKDTTAIFTPAQMAVEIESLEMVSELPNAEDWSFGSSSNAYEYGYPEGKFFQNTTNTSGNRKCHKFLVNQDFGCYGFRTWLRYKYEYVLQLWDVEKDSMLAELTVTPTEVDTWKDYMLASPVNLFAGKEYVMTAYTTTVGGAMWFRNDPSYFNAKITDMGTSAISDVEAPPSGMGTFSKYVYFIRPVTPIIGHLITESVIQEYKIQTITMNSIATEVQRITNTTSNLTTAQIQTGLESVVLQEKTVTPTTEQQEIVPDTGYYGFSKVTVEAAEIGTAIPENARLYYVGNGVCLSDCSSITSTSMATGTNLEQR